MPSHKLKQRVWILSSLPYHSSPTRVLVPAYLILSSWPQISPPCIRLDSPPCTAVNYFLFHMAMLQALQNRSFLLNFLASQKNCLPKEAVMGEAPLFWQSWARAVLSVTQWGQKYKYWPGQGPWQKVSPFGGEKEIKHLLRDTNTVVHAKYEFSLQSTAALRRFKERPPQYFNLASFPPSCFAGLFR